MIIENAIETHYRKLDGRLSNEYMELYESFSNEKLQLLFSTLHTMLTNCFNSMNERLPTTGMSAHFWADPSRELIESIEIIEALERSLKNSDYSFSVDEYYRNKLSLCKSFLSKSGGSSIPPNTEKMELYYTIPIFIPKTTIIIENQNNISELKLIGEGSYAQVFKYSDKFYLKKFALKRAKNNLSAKELERFKREYSQMSTMNSPYILEVYGYNDKNNEYIMEYMDASLNDYVVSNNTKLSFQKRVKLGLQIIKAFSYIHSKGVLHRDVSPKNILLKVYDDTIVVKIADFGLVKIINSDLTSENTQFKGYFNDPSLVVEGFDNYNILHETYALTRILYFVLTGRTSTDKAKPHLVNFVAKGLNSNQEHRYQNTSELRNAFQCIKPN
ncbi:MAG: protein kinase family protein [Gammaproteobacteria bacterium]|nr:protein kinase family protein [Gammaproteobacteria bacterium]